MIVNDLKRGGNLLCLLNVTCCALLHGIRVDSLYLENGGAEVKVGWQIGGDCQNLIQLLDGVIHYLQRQQNILTTKQHGHLVPGTPDLSSCLFSQEVELRLSVKGEDKIHGVGFACKS